MLTRTKLVYWPAQEEIDADIREYGTLGWKSRAMYGNAAVEGGSGPDDNDSQTNLVDALANMMHYARYYPEDNMDFDRALETAREHFEAEVDGE